MRTRQAAASAVGVVAATALALSGTAPAQAAVVGGDGGGDATEAIERVAPEVFDGAAGQGAEGRGVEGLRMPSDAGQPVTLGTGADAVAVSLPRTGTTTEAQAPGGQREFDHGDGSTTVPVAKSDGSAQITTVIEEAGAPQAYAYDVRLPEGASLDEQKGGGVAVTGADGAFLGGFNPPWARTADGKSVPTRYEVRGDTLVQRVDHRGLPDSAYPVVADPWLGRDLMYQPWVTPDPRGYVINVDPTGWGRAWSGPATHFAHTSEMRTKLGAQGHLLTPTIEEQLRCHVAYNPFEWGTYNLESWRPWVAWSRQAWPAQCNP